LCADALDAVAIPAERGEGGAMSDVQIYYRLGKYTKQEYVRREVHDALVVRLEEALRLCLDAIDDYDAESPEGSEVYAQAANKARAVLKERP
jgi:hypothetical protein